MWGYGLSFSSRLEMQSALERVAEQGDSPVAITEQDVKVSRVLLPGYGAGNWEALTSNRKYVLRPIANQYREGKLKRTHDRELKDPEIL